MKAINPLLSSYVTCNNVEGLRSKLQELRLIGLFRNWIQEESTQILVRRAIQLKNKEIVQVFLEEGVDPDMEAPLDDITNQPLIYFAAKVGSLPIVKLLLSMGSNRECYFEIVGDLIENSENRNEAIVQFLSEALKDQNFKPCHLVDYGVTLDKILHPALLLYRDTETERIRMFIRDVLDVAFGLDLDNETFNLFENFDVSGLNFVGITVDSRAITKTMLYWIKAKGSDQALVTISSLTEFVSDEERRQTLTENYHQSLPKLGINEGDQSDVNHLLDWGVLEDKESLYGNLPYFDNFLSAFVKFPETQKDLSTLREMWNRFRQLNVEGKILIGAIVSKNHLHWPDVKQSLELYIQVTEKLENVAAFNSFLDDWLSGEQQAFYDFLFLLRDAWAIQENHAGSLSSTDLVNGILSMMVEENAFGTLSKAAKDGEDHPRRRRISVFLNGSVGRALVEYYLDDLKLMNEYTDLLGFFSEVYPPEFPENLDFYPIELDGDDGYEWVLKMPSAAPLHAPDKVLEVVFASEERIYSSNFKVSLWGNIVQDVGGPTRQFISELIQGILTNSTEYQFQEDQGAWLPTIERRAFTSEVRRRYITLGRVLGFAMIHKYPIGVVFSPQLFHTLRYFTGDLLNEQDLELNRNFKDGKPIEYLSWFLELIEPYFDAKMFDQLKSAFLGEDESSLEEGKNILDEIFYEEIDSINDVIQMRELLRENILERYERLFRIIHAMAQGMRQYLPFKFNRIEIKEWKNLQLITPAEFSFAVQGSINKEHFRSKIEFEDGTDELIENVSGWIDEWLEGLPEDNDEALKAVIKEMTGATALGSNPIFIKFKPRGLAQFESCFHRLHISSKINRTMFMKLLNDCSAKFNDR